MGKDKIHHIINLRNHTTKLQKVKHPYKYLDLPEMERDRSAPYDPATYWSRHKGKI